MKAICKPRLPALVLVLAGVMLATSCATTQPVIAPPLVTPKADAGKSAGSASLDRPTKDLVSTMPAPPAPVKTKTKTPPPPVEAPANEEATIVFNFEQLPLPSFIKLVYGEILKRNVNIDQKLLARKDLVTLRSSTPQTPSQVEAAMKLLLKSYGIAVVQIDGLVRILPDDASLGYLPEIQRGAALPDTPIAMRPQFQLVELKAVRNSDIANFIKTMYGDRIKLQEDSQRNAVLLSGTADNLRAAIESIAVLDQPMMRGRGSMRLNPQYWSADDLAKRLVEVLSAEGYAVAPVGQAAGGLRYPVTILPVAAINAVLVFAISDDISNHVADLVKTLDQPNTRGLGRNFFTYQAEHVDAESLAATLDKLMTGAGTTTTASGTASTNASATSTTGTSNRSGATTASASASQGSGRAVVDKGTNTIIFNASPDDYSSLVSLLKRLDRPKKEALIEVTVAEVALTDNMQLGVEWFFTNSMNNGWTGSGGTLGGLALGTAGFTYKMFDSLGSTRVVLNALAATNRATILSTPRVMARNGETAQIQVGQEVPIVTSQQSTPLTGSSTSITQTIQYRNTGVILKVKPVIHSGDQVDLDVEQEVSAAQTTDTGVNTSPTISTRKLQTRLTMRNASTVLLGGLISDDSTRGSSGIPFIKDIPFIGNLFSKDTRNGTRRELIVLITPYIIGDDQEAQAITQAFRNRLGGWAQDAAVPIAPAGVAAPAAADVSAPAETKPGKPVVAPATLSQQPSVQAAQPVVNAFETQPDPAALPKPAPIEDAKP
ncbi:type II secretion system protein GspD [Niveibacterium umoris]|uniref:General secretion pathway protein D n=1 Tax=Niveibacterium umoris TaxID=1193620 RepID=A0A840BGZ0_9RHOO|nr:type II secretion system secretin GspD [Niveibacterium umoris]MBB4012240.1 general secretion pathway protein D [Niveibacterium umoris]